MLSDILNIYSPAFYGGLEKTGAYPCKITYFAAT
jgi:hypothetical protein